MKRRHEIEDEQWDPIKNIVTCECNSKGGCPPKDDQKMLNAMRWIARTGAPWRDMPECYGSWSSVYTRFRRWQKSGVLEQILERVSIEPDFENVMLDATIVPVHQHGAGAKGGSNFNL